MWLHCSARRRPECLRSSAYVLLNTRLLQLCLSVIRSVPALLGYLRFSYRMLSTAQLVLLRCSYYINYEHICAGSALDRYGALHSAVRSYTRTELAQ
jgi:hypothetical protein